MTERFYRRRFNGNEGSADPSSSASASRRLRRLLLRHGGVLKSITLWQGRLRSARVGGGAPGAHAADGHGASPFRGSPVEPDLGGALLQALGHVIWLWSIELRVRRDVQAASPTSRPVAFPLDRTGPLSPQGQARLS